MTDTSPMELSPAPASSDEPYISLTIHSDMHLIIAPTEVAREGEHNSALFKIVKQPSSLDSYVCRAEIQTSEGKTYRLVIAKEFRLTNDISVVGPGRLQLVYSDGDVILRKTDIATFHVTSSVNAIDPSDPDFQDGLAQLATAAFAAVTSDNSGIAFYNVAAQPVGFVPWPIGSGGALDEATANLLYLRLNGDNEMTGNITMSLEGGSRGILFDPLNNRGMMYADGTSIRFRRAQGNADLTLENADGSIGSRSPIVTQLMGDARYLQLLQADARYLQLIGGILTGNLQLTSSQGIDAPIGLIVGGRQAQLRWDNALILTRGQANEPVQIENNNGTNRSEIITQLTGDARYAQLTGVQMQGPFISQTGSGNTNLGVSVGDNSTGFWRTGTYLICVMGGQMVWQSNVTELMFGVRVNMATGQITNVGAPTAPGDAVNRAYVDAIPRPNARTYLTNSLDLTTTAQILSDNPFPVANNSQKTVTVTVFPSFSGGTPSAFYDLIFACSIAPLIEARTTVYPTSGAYMYAPVRFAATVTPAGGLIPVQVTVRLAAAGTGTLTITGSGADRRSYVTIEEQQN